tara:strand:- start:4168 stop:5460 length:1293 start_codon:yes stop_codon:yes gene_type:complete
MKELDDLIEGTFAAKKIKTQSLDLISLVESVLDNYYELSFDKPKVPASLQEQEATKFEKGREFVLSLPKFAPNENWGDPNTADRQSVDRIFSAIGGSATLDAKLAFLERITDPSANITGTRRIISSLILLESLSSILTSFQAAPAGFVFESFLAALLRGHQIPATGANTIADLQAFSQLKGSENLSVSLKLLNPNTKIEGSYTDLVDSLNNEGTMTYVVARKDGKKLNIESFVFTQDNFIKALTTLASSDKMNVRSRLFQLDGEKDALSSIKTIDDAPSWQEKYKLLQQTAGYRVKKGNKIAPSQEEDSQEELPIAAEALQLNESKTQWSLDGPILDKLYDQGAMERTNLGSLPYDPELIYQIAEQRMVHLNGNLLELFSSTKSLSDNVNLYISEEARETAINHGKEAVRDASSAAESLRSEIKDDQKQK